MNWDWAFVVEIMPRMLDGLRVTVLATLAGSAVGIALGLVFAIVRVARVPVATQAVKVYVYFFRGTPLLVQFYVAYYMLPLVGISMDAFPAGFLTRGLNSATYFSETFRAGIQGVPRGQWEAARALNLSMARTWRSVVIPQALPPIVPALGNYVNLMFKVSALLAAISVSELFHTAIAIGNSVYRYLEPMTIAGVLYLAISIPTTLVIRAVERRVATAS